MLGYTGWIRLRVEASADILLGTGGTVPNGRPRLESASAYGGRIKTPVSEIGVANPRDYDWPMWDGNIEFEVNEGVITRQIKPWIFDRQRAGEVLLSTRTDNEQFFDECYWKDISLDASEGNVLTGQIGFLSPQRDT